MAVVKSQGVVGHRSHIHRLQCVYVLHDVVRCQVHAIVVGLGGEQKEEEEELEMSEGYRRMRRCKEEVACPYSQIQDGVVDRGRLAHCDQHEGGQIHLVLHAVSRLQPVGQHCRKDTDRSLEGKAEGL